MLDPGHSINEPGALGIQGIYEKHYNDLFVEALARQLQHRGIRVSISRTLKKESQQRARLINKRSGISICGQYIVDFKDEEFVRIKRDQIASQVAMAIESFFLTTCR